MRQPPFIRTPPLFNFTNPNIFIHHPHFHPYFPISLLLIMLVLAYPQPLIQFFSFMPLNIIILTFINIINHFVIYKTQAGTPWLL